jgi:ubiquinone/menaquinone biosynthesis C-methylase UbiE
MADQIFENDKLAAIYDTFDGSRDDLIHYLEIAKEFNAKNILDIGCGTGCLATLLSNQCFNVTGLDPALASLSIAKKKKEASKVQWIHGDSSKAPKDSFDLAVMTGNVAQVFISDQEWEENLINIKSSLLNDGLLVFEVRDPSKKDWKNWTSESTFQKINVPSVGMVEAWCEITDETEDLVSFRWSYKFESDGEIVTSDSTLRFRQKEDISTSLTNHGFEVLDIRDAPDRPGKEFVFIAKIRK